MTLQEKITNIKEKEILNLIKIMKAHPDLKAQLEKDIDIIDNITAQGDDFVCTLYYNDKIRINNVSKFDSDILIGEIIRTAVNIIEVLD